jgi:siroheme synthase (precorrin-2 oxidase/ferrochelatase)
VTVVSPEGSAELSTLAEQGELTWAREEFQPSHLDAAFLVVAATDDDSVNDRVVRAADAADVPLVCHASSREVTEVAFAATHDVDGATVAVFSDGESPTRARRLRDRIAALISPSAVEGTQHTSGDSCLILLVHGSRNPRWRGSLENLLAYVAETAPESNPRLAYVQFTGPTLQETVAEGLAAGIRRFRVLPLFMASAGHVEKDVLPMVQDAATAYPGAVLEVLTPIGEFPPFHGLVRDIAKDL